MKHRPLKVPKSKQDIARQLKWLAEHMTDIATSMDYYGGYAPWAQHGKELAGAAMICREWAKEIEIEIEDFEKKNKRRLRNDQSRLFPCVSSFGS